MCIIANFHIVSFLPSVFRDVGKYHSFALNAIFLVLRDGGKPVSSYKIYEEERGLGFIFLGITILHATSTLGFSCLQTGFRENRATKYWQPNM